MGDIVFGDLNAEDYPWLEVTTSPEDIPFSPHIKIHLDVTDKRPNGQRYTATETISTFHINKSEPERLEFLMRVIERMARTLSVRLFEIDPRIGLPLYPDFPSCPLFDPPYVTEPYKDIFHNPNPNSNHPAKQALLRCAFCQRQLFFVSTYRNEHRPAVWCGGNVGFAHNECAPWVQLLPIPP